MNIENNFDLLIKKAWEGERPLTTTDRLAWFHRIVERYFPAYGPADIWIKSLLREAVRAGVSNLEGFDLESETAYVALVLRVPGLRLAIAGEDDTAELESELKETQDLAYDLAPSLDRWIFYLESFPRGTDNNAFRKTRVREVGNAYAVVHPSKVWLEARSARSARGRGKDDTAGSGGRLIPHVVGPVACLPCLSKVRLAAAERSRRVTICFELAPGRGRRSFDLEWSVKDGSLRLFPSTVTDELPDPGSYAVEVLLDDGTTLTGRLKLPEDVYAGIDLGKLEGREIVQIRGRILDEDSV